MALPLSGTNLVSPALPQGFIIKMHFFSWFPYTHYTQTPYTFVTCWCPLFLQQGQRHLHFYLDVLTENKTKGNKNRKQKNITKCTELISWNLNSSGSHRNFLWVYFFLADPQYNLTTLTEPWMCCCYCLATNQNSHRHPHCKSDSAGLQWQWRCFDSFMFQNVFKNSFGFSAVWKS